MVFAEGSFQLAASLFVISIADLAGGFRLSTVPREAQAFHQKLLADSLSYSYSALEFGAPNDTQFKTVTLIRNLSHPGPVKDYKYEDSRWATTPRPAEQLQFLVQIPEYYSASYQPAFLPSTTPKPLPSVNLSYYYVQDPESYLFQPTTMRAQKKKKQSRNKKPKRLNAKYRPIGLEHINGAVKQVLYSYDFGVGKKLSYVDSSPNLSPGYSKVIQNPPNSLPTLVFSAPQPNHNITHVRDSKPKRTKLKGVDLSRIIKSRHRPRNRFSSNYSAPFYIQTSRQQSVDLKSDNATTSTPQASAQEIEVFRIFPETADYFTTSELSSTEETPLPTTTTDVFSDAPTYHPTITKIPGRRTHDIVLNTTTEFPQLSRRLKAIRKIIRRVPAARKA